MNAVILIVVWFAAGAAVHYQLPFPSAALCQHARQTVLDDAARARKELGGAAAFAVSAICVSQSEVKR